MALVALISNPHSTGNITFMPRIRDFVAKTTDLLHYELANIDEIPNILLQIALKKPDILVINGGDGTVQAVLTSLIYEAPFGKTPPPLAILPNGKTNLIAIDLGVSGAPLKALERLLQLAQTGTIAKALVQRHLMSLDTGDNQRPVIGMFLGAAGLMKTILFCRHKLYPLGIPNGLAHIIAYMAFAWAILSGNGSKPGSTFLPDPMRIFVPKKESIQGRFAVLLTTTLEHLLLGIKPDYGPDKQGALKLICIEQARIPVFKAIWACLKGRLGRHSDSGIHVRAGEEILLEGVADGVILDGELIAPAPGSPLILRAMPAHAFVSFAPL
jgi:hypothetical protein